MDTEKSGKSEVSSEVAPSGVGPEPLSPSTPEPAPEGSASEVTTAAPKPSRRKVKDLPRDIVAGSSSTASADTAKVNLDSAKEVEAFDRALKAISKQNSAALAFAAKYGKAVQRVVFDNPTTKVFRSKANEATTPELRNALATYEFRSERLGSAGKVTVAAISDDGEAVELLPGEAVMFYAWIGGARNLATALGWVQSHPMIFASIGMASVCVSHFFTVQNAMERLIAELQNGQR